MKRVRSYNVENECNNFKRHCPIGRYVPIRRRKPRKFEFYEDLINACTEEFTSKHLIPCETSRLRLFDMCDDLLGSGNETFIHTYYGDRIYDVLDEACFGLALQRLGCIVNRGYFDTGEINTIIVSSNERIFLHMEKSYRSKYDLFICIEQKRSYDDMNDHLVTDEKGKIYHYRH